MRNNLKARLIMIAVFSAAVVLLASCKNPFAPGMADSDTGTDVLKDARTVNGLFENFRYSYRNKDTSVYGGLLTDDFVFDFYDNGIPVSRTREQDIKTTFNMFQAAQTLDVIWDDAYIEAGDTVLKDITRGFYLNIVFSPTDIIYLNGRATFRIVRQNQSEIWKIKEWWDEAD